MGDLRPYGLMQLAPMLLIPLSLRLYAPRYSGDRDIMAVLGLYGLALLFDLGDRPVFEFSGGLVSGHTLKHIVAALAVVWVTRVRQLRAQVLVFARAHVQKCHYNSANCSGAAGFSIPNA